MDVTDALRELISEPSGDERGDLIAAATEAWRRRHANTEAGAAVIGALADSGLSYRQIEELTGIPSTTAHRWARPPEDDN